MVLPKNSASYDVKPTTRKNSMLSLLSSESVSLILRISTLSFGFHDRDNAGRPSNLLDRALKSSQRIKMPRQHGAQLRWTPLSVVLVRTHEHEIIDIPDAAKKDDATVCASAAIECCCSYVLCVDGSSKPIQPFCMANRRSMHVEICLSSMARKIMLQPHRRAPRVHSSS